MYLNSHLGIFFPLVKNSVVVPDHSALIHIGLASQIRIHIEIKSWIRIRIRIKTIEDTLVLKA
jgi:hypothetical protein